ncbi:MAG: TIGR04283 family arsenosugar biosynthesis glycosyltransferase [Deltaproteobacteria bacterium]|nr:TIGR04283 family arsenosugar biosynthesis glycosyltransferase [Deltaproteobacteria bacterium]
MTEPGHICVFAKPPVPGGVKTRLAPAMGQDGAAALARAFLADTWATVTGVPWATPVIASTTEDPEALGVDGDTEVWLQGEGDLGARMERVISRALRSGPWAIAIGADSPGLPQTQLDAARDALQEADAVLGPTPDGGYYLLGLRRCPPGLLGELPWSQSNTLVATRRRLEERGLTVRMLPPFFDVDEPRDLRRLRAFLDQFPDAAPHTRRVLTTRVPLLKPRLSVVIPVLDEERRIEVRLRELGAMQGIDEVVVVDGSSTDRTREIVKQFPAVRLLSAPRGRARQLNAGANVALGEVLLFLHADVSLPVDAAAHVEQVLADPANVAGAFRTWTVAEDPPWLFGPLLHLADLRSRLTRHPYGDQALFVRREVFEALGGFPDIPLMEDYAFSREIRRRGRIGLARARVHVSGRRFIARPVFYTALVWSYPALYRWGVPPEMLARWYHDIR